MYQQARITDARGNVIRVAHPTLPEHPRTTASAITAGATSITVADNQGFANGNFILYGQPQQPTTELVTISAGVTRGTGITASAAVFNHPQDTPVLLSLWNQVEISGASTTDGVKTVLSTKPIEWAQHDTEHVDSSATYPYYFARYKNSVSSTFSDYSDPAPATGYTPDTVRAVKTTALELVGEQIGTVITDDFLDREITNCEIDIWKEKRRWAEFYVDNYSLGQFAVGQTDFPLPTDISDDSTNSAIRSVRSRHTGALRYADQEVISGLLYGTAMTQLNADANMGDTSISVASAGDFTESGGSLRIGSDTVTYTSASGVTISGIPASGDGSITQLWQTGTKVWQGGNPEVSPSVYTIRPGYLSIVLPPSVTYFGNGLYLSYYAKPTYPDSDADILSWPDPELYHWWLAWKIELRRHNGTPTEASMNFNQQYLARKQTLLSRARLQDTPKMIPVRNHNRQRFSQSDSFIVPWTVH